MFCIEDFEVYKLTLPLGRTVGDNNCSYDLINVTAVVLKSNHGHTGWGYAESAWQGKFKHDAWYMHQLPDLVTIESDFANSWWIQIQNKHPEDLEEERLNYSSGFQHLDTATRMALWDLMAFSDDNQNPIGYEYCRVFTKDTPYYTHKDLQKISARIDGGEINGNIRKSTYSVFDSTFNLNIAPSSEESSTNILNVQSENASVKKYMFSIETLS